ncbi:MAG: aminotransferase class I/II-fold pyridoxal phosphate-dependent enzyme, partial [Candidatus Bipolaricaulota bacterium]
MVVPFFDLVRQYESIRAEIEDAVGRVLASGRFILGPEVEAFEGELAARCGVDHAVGVASGTDALLLSLQALGIGAGDRVLVPTLTFFATAGAVARVGATPAFADIDAETFNLDAEQVRAILDEDRARSIRAILPVHLFGRMVAMDEMVALADAHGAIVIEDAAQAVGARRGEHLAGTVGHVGCFSFFPTKNLAAYR